MSGVNRTGKMDDLASRFLAGLRKRHDEIGRELNAKMSSCKDGSETCQSLSGNILINGMPIRCQRIEDSPMGCRAGVERYVRECQGYLERGLGVRGVQSTACFLRDGFIEDNLSRAARAYAFEGGYQRREDLLIMGPSGPGKTFCSLAILAHLNVTLKVRSAMKKAHRLLSSGRWTDELDEAVQVPLLLLDELGPEANTQSVMTNLLSLLDDRFNAGFPTIITTNLKSWEQVQQRYPDERIITRLDRFSHIVTSLQNKR